MARLLQSFNHQRTPLWQHCILWVLLRESERTYRTMILQRRADQSHKPLNRLRGEFALIKFCFAIGGLLQRSRCSRDLLRLGAYDRGNTQLEFLHGCDSGCCFIAQELPLRRDFAS
jgi:hypothetical protein